MFATRKRELRIQRNRKLRSYLMVFELDLPLSGQGRPYLDHFSDHSEDHPADQADCCWTGLGLILAQNLRRQVTFK